MADEPNLSSPQPPAAGDLNAYAPELGDWRLLFAGWATGFGDVPFDAPKAVKLVASWEDRGKYHAYPAPCAAALHLNTAWREAAIATKMKSALQWTATFVPGYTGRSLKEGTEGALFDYFERFIVATTSSFAAIEAFCNMTVVDRGGATVKVRRKKNTEILTPEQVEEGVGTETKLSRVLPDLLGVPTPSCKAIWADFVRLKNFRDAVTHFTRADQARRAPRLHEPTALLQAYNTDPYTLPETAQALIQHFMPGNATARWMSNPAWNRNAVGASEAG